MRERTAEAVHAERVKPVGASRWRGWWTGTEVREAGSATDRPNEAPRTHTSRGLTYFIPNEPAVSTTTRGLEVNFSVRLSRHVL